MAAKPDKRERRPGDRHRPRHMAPIPPELWQRLERDAKALDRPVAWLIRQRLAEHYGPADAPPAQ